MKDTERTGGPHYELNNIPFYSSVVGHNSPNIAPTLSICISKQITASHFFQVSLYLIHIPKKD